MEFMRVPLNFECIVRLETNLYILALHLDPEINERLTSYVGIHLDNVYNPNIYVPVVYMETQGLSFNDVKDIISKTFSEWAPAFYSLEGYKRVKNREDSRLRDIEYGVDILGGLEVLLGKLTSALKGFKSDKGRARVTLYDEKLKARGIRYLDKETSKIVERRLMRKPGILDSLLFKKTTVTLGDDAYRLSVFDSSGELVGEFDAARKRWLSRNMVNRPAQWGLTRAAAEYL